MKKIFYILFLSVLFVSCDKTYQMPNYFRHHENGNVKYITIKTFQVNGNDIIPYPDNFGLIWGEEANGTLTYDENGNILSDRYYNYIYDETGKLIFSVSKETQFAACVPQDLIYTELDLISKLGDRTFRYNDNNQICAITEDIESQGFFPASHREYVFNDDGQMKSCNFNYNQEIYVSEYDECGNLKHHVQLMSNVRVQEYFIEITAKDENGNWIERRIKETNFNGVPKEYIQKREIRYY